VDGRCNEEAWDGVESLPMTMHQPTFRGGLTAQTDVRVAHDAEAIYVCGRLHDNPDGLRAHSLTRDEWNGGDYFGVFLDRYSDNETALYFWTTPAGIRGDWAYADDGASINESWNAVWSVATQRTGEGWSLEMRIPLSSLGLEAPGGEATVGLILFRSIARKNELQTYPGLSPDRNPWMPSRAREVTLSGVDPEQPLYVTPYVLGGREQTAGRTGDGTEIRQQTDLKADVGGDLRYRFSNGLTLDATVNTDFAQVEADNARVNLSRFSLFFPEKRQFFQVRSGLFEFPTYRTGPDRLFYSRRIGLDDGRPIPLLGGAKLTGRVGAWDLGLIDVQTAGDREQPTENVGVARVRRRILNERSYAGGLLTTRAARDGSWHATYGLDGKLHMGGNEFLTLRWAQTIDPASGGTVELPRSSGFARVQWKRRQRVGLAYRATVARGGPRFSPDVGFSTRRDVTELSGNLGYSILLNGTSALRFVQPGALQGYAVLRNPDGSIESARVGYNGVLQWDNRMSVRVRTDLRVEDLRAPLRLPEATTVPAARYSFAQAALRLNSPSGRNLEMGLNLGLSSYYGGRRGDVSVNGAWNPSRFFGLSGAYQFDTVRFPSRGEGFDAHVTRLQVRAALNKHLSSNTFIQYNSAAERVTANVRLRYHLKAGTDLWLVYNERLNTNRSRASSVLPRTGRRTLLIKATYMFGV